jgi:hypothetical protein
MKYGILYVYRRKNFKLRRIFFEQFHLVLRENTLPCAKVKTHGKDTSFPCVFKTHGKDKKIVPPGSVLTVFSLGVSRGKQAFGKKSLPRAIKKTHGELMSLPCIQKNARQTICYRVFVPCRAPCI